jgi:hypothetical protein
MLRLIILERNTIVPALKETCSAVLSEANLELEVDGESRVANTHFLSV